jgi:hypothetical protein
MGFGEALDEGTPDYLLRILAAADTGRKEGGEPPVVRK